MMNGLGKILAFCLLGSCVTACGQNQVGIEQPQSVNPLQNATLQFALGTFHQANSGTTFNGPYVTFNVVGSLRNPFGQSAVLDDGVAILGPPNFIVDGATEGGAPNEILKALKSYPLFGDGLGEVGSALNANLNQSLNGGIIQVLAGPPAWPVVTGGQYPAGFTAYPESVINRGLIGNDGNPFTPVAGQYTMQVTVPVGYGGSLTNQTMSVSATLSNITPLPPFPTPVFAPDGSGGGTVTVNVPPGVTEAFVNFTVSNQLCYPPSALTVSGSQAITISHYTLMTRQSGAQTLVLPDNLGPPDPNTGNLLHTMCTKADNQNPLTQVPAGTPLLGATYTVYAVGVDYPAYEQSYPNSTVPNPTLTGPNGQADATASDINVGLINYP